MAGIRRLSPPVARLDPRASHPGGRGGGRPSPPCPSRRRPPTSFRTKSSTASSRCGPGILCGGRPCRSPSAGCRERPSSAKWRPTSGRKAERRTWCSTCGRSRSSPRSMSRGRKAAGFPDHRRDPPAQGRPAAGEGHRGSAQRGGILHGAEGVHGAKGGHRGFLQRLERIRQGADRRAGRRRRRR